MAFLQYIQEDLMNSMMNCLSKLCMQDYKRRIIILQGRCNFTKKHSIITVTKKRSNCFHKQKPTLPSMTKEKTVKQSITMLLFLGRTWKFRESVEELKYSQCKRAQKILLSHAMLGSRQSLYTPRAPSLCSGMGVGEKNQNHSTVQLHRTSKGFFPPQLTSNGIESSLVNHKYLFGQIQ